MNNILDSNEQISKEYTLKSYKNFTQSLCIYLFFILGVIIQLKVKDQSDLIALFFSAPMLLIIPISLIGFVRGIKSIWYKEPSASKKTIGLLGNLIIMCLAINVLFTKIMALEGALQ